MPKFKVMVVTERWKKGDMRSGVPAENDGFSTKSVDVETADAASAKGEAKRVSGFDVVGEPILVS